MHITGLPLPTTLYKKATNQQKLDYTKMSKRELHYSTIKRSLRFVTLMNYGV